MMLVGEPSHQEVCISANGFWTVLPSQSSPLVFQCPEVPGPEEPLENAEMMQGREPAKGDPEPRPGGTVL